MRLSFSCLAIFIAQASFAQDYPSTDTPITILDNTGFDSVITVADDFCVSDVNVSVDVSHTFVGDLTLALTAPNGSQVTLHNRSGGSGDDIVTTYDSQGGGSIPDGPGSLDDLTIDQSAGDWRLTVFDHSGGDTGTLNSWTLHLGSAGPVCPPIAEFDTLDVEENLIATATLRATSPTGQGLSYSIIRLPVNGNLWTSDNLCIDSVPWLLPDDAVRYKPAIGFQGIDAFKFVANDGQDSNIANVTCTVGSSGNPISEDFEQGIPADWQIVDLQPGGSFDNWNTTTYYGRGNFTNGEGVAACADSDSWGPGAGDYDIALVTSPVPIDATSELSYTTNYQNYAGDDFADVAITTDNGANWSTLLSWNEDHGGFGGQPGEDVSIDLSGFAGQTAQIRFRYHSNGTGGWDWYWEVDDVTVTGTADSRDPADFDRDGMRNTADFLAFLNAFTTNQPRADHNSDCVINTSDFLDFLNDFNGP